MLKKFGLFLILNLLFTSFTYAGFYLGPSLAYNHYYVQSASYEGVLPQLSVGYSTLTNEWIYVAAELFGNVKGWKIHNSSVNNLNVRPRYSMGASLLPGLILDPLVLVYIRLGTIYTRFDQSGAMRNAYQIGGGLQYKISDTWEARAEYDYMQYNHLSGLGSPRAGAAMVGLVYYFNVAQY